MTTSINPQSILSTFGNFDWLNDDNLGLCEEICDETILSSLNFQPNKRPKSLTSRSLTAPVSNTITKISTRDKALSSSGVSKPRLPTIRRRGRKGKSIYRGVCVTREGKWRAVIYKERKQLYLGVFESEIDAAKAHDKAAREHFGEQAMVNFLEPQDSKSMQHIPTPPEAVSSTVSTISPANAQSKTAKTFSTSKQLFANSTDTKVNNSQFIFGNTLDFDIPFDGDLFSNESLGMFSFETFINDPIPMDEIPMDHDPSLQLMTDPMDFEELCFV